MKRLIAILALVCIASNSFAFSGMEDKYQHDADIYRLKHLEYFGKLIEEYRSFANPIGEHYHKVEITNETPGRRGLWKLEDLYKNQDFQKNPGVDSGWLFLLFRDKTETNKPITGNTPCHLLMSGTYGFTTK
ncbi:MAG: hypothetical protein ACLFMN_01675 [Desulfobacterales bacterium]